MKFRGALVAFAAVLAVGAGSASANNGGGSYPPDPGSTGISVDKPVVETGDTLTVSAHGLCGGTVWFELAGSSTVGLLISPPLKVKDDGTASYTFTVPGPASQWYVAWAKQPPECDTTLNTPVQVVDPGTNPPPPPAPGKVDVTLDDIIVGTSSSFVNASASGLCPGIPVTFTVSGDATGSITVVAGADGKASASIAANGAGSTYTITVTQSCGTNTSATFHVTKAAAPATPAAEPAAPAPAVVTPAAAAPAVVAPAAVSPAVIAPAAAAPVAAAAAPVVQAGNLPTTGSDPANMVQIAAFAVAAGLGMVMVTGLRRRKHNATISAN